MLDEVRLICERKFITPFTTPTDYNYNPADIEVVSGVARLTAAPGPPVSGNTLNSNFSSAFSPAWTTGQSPASPLWSITRQTSQGNPGGYARVRSPSTAGTIMIGYIQQSFVVTANTVTAATLDLNWQFTRTGGVPDSVRLLAYVDTASGLTLSPPNNLPPAGAVMDLTLPAAVPAWQVQPQINVLSKITGPGTYYLKVAVYVDFHNTTNGQITVGYDNVMLNWSGTGASGYTATSPAIRPNTSYIVSNIDVWGGFEEVATIPGGTSITYQLSDDSGTTWQYWSGGWVPATLPSNANTVSVVAANIATFPTTNQSLMWRAYLNSNGTQQVMLDEVKVWYREMVGVVTNYAIFGALQSSAFNMTNNSPVEIVEWDEDVSTCPATCDIKFQVHTAPDNGGMPGLWGAWYGVTGAGTYFNLPTGAMVPMALNGNQWVQYRAELTGDGSATPMLQEVRINYQ